LWLPEQRLPSWLRRWQLHARQQQLLSLQQLLLLRLPKLQLLCLRQSLMPQFEQVKVEQYLGRCLMQLRFELG
jgi:hypothetical protein